MAADRSGTLRCLSRALLWLAGLGLFRLFGLLALLRLRDGHQRRYGDVAMGSYPRLRDGKPVSDLVLRSADADRLAEAAETLKAALGV